MNKSFDSALQFDECAVRNELGNLSTNFAADRELRVDVLPWVVLKLLEAERNALFLFIDVEDNDLKWLSDREHFAGVVDAAPAHVGDVKKSVHTLKIDERSEVGDVFDETLDLIADLD